MPFCISLNRIIPNTNTNTHTHTQVHILKNNEEPPQNPKHQKGDLNQVTHKGPTSVRRQRETWCPEFVHPLWSQLDPIILQYTIRSLSPSFQILPFTSGIMLHVLSCRVCIEWSVKCVSATERWGTDLGRGRESNGRISGPNRQTDRHQTASRCNIFM
jgi:hypothetical protein